MKSRLFGFGIFLIFVLVIAACSCFMSGRARKTPVYEFQPGQEVSKVEKYNEGELPKGASPEDVVPMGQVFVNNSGDEIKLVAELSGGVIDINIKFAGEPEKTKFQINTVIDPTTEWGNFEIIPFLRGAEDGKYHFWLYIREK